MPNKKVWVMTAGVLIISLISATTLTASMLVGKLSPGNETLVWGLDTITLATPDPTMLMGKGTLTQDYTIEVKAKTKNDNLVPESQVRLTLTAFSPASDGSGRQGGLWYVQDNRMITVQAAAPETVKVWYTP